jgi:hypothetical protein
MNTGNLDFGFKMEGIDRSALLAEAAYRIDALQSDLGIDADNNGRPSEEANIVLELIGDEARLAAFPDIYKITNQDFLTHDFKVPTHISQLYEDYKFYWIRFPVGLVTKRNWAFNMIEMRIEFNKEDAAPLRPKAFQIFPDKRFQTLFEANQELKIGIDANFELAAKSGKIGIPLGEAEGKIHVYTGANAAAKMGLVFGPYVYKVKKAAIDHNAPGMEWVFWRLDGAEFFQEDNPELIVVAQVPKDTKAVVIEAKLQAYRNFNFAAANLRQLVFNLPKGLRAFFQGGIPTQPDEKNWDITSRL